MLKFSIFQHVGRWRALLGCFPIQLEHSLIHVRISKIKELSNSIGELSNSISELSTSNGELSNSIRELFHSIGELSNSIRELSKCI